MMLIPFRRFVTALLVVVSPLWGVPQLIAAEGSPAAIPAASTDVEIESVPVRLSSEGRLRGMVKTDAGNAAAGVPVVLGRNGKPLGRTIADEQGRFEFGPLKPGKYQLATSDAGAMVDLFTDADAPEQAVQTIEVSRGAMIARGQSPGEFLSNPLFIGLVIAAAIAIPLAIAVGDDDDDDAS